MNSTRQKTVLKKLVSMFIIVLFVISIGSLAVSQEAQKTMIIKGTIISISNDTGKIAVKDEYGKIMSLTAGLGIDLEDFKVGYQVVIKCDGDWVIKSITKQK